ncbi:MAG TPA: hypothetical protein VGQ38_17815 [Gaiellaceae bacterium]|jgi:hypothetical protein|nr:hypothetical protein [Gaiellaceae bacterium]
MKKLILTAAMVAGLALAGTAAAALTPWTFVGTGVTCSPTSTFSGGVLHLSKPCTTETVASAGATVTGVSGQTFTSASFTLANAAQCQGGSPRFNVVANGTTFFLGCNNVTPTINADGSATYTFTAATIAAGGGQVPVPTGTISSVDVLIDVQGTADLSNITFNGQLQNVVAGGPTSKAQCKKGGWKSFTNPSFKNQGQCVSWFNHHAQHHGKGKGH